MKHWLAAAAVLLGAWAGAQAQTAPSNDGPAVADEPAYVVVAVADRPEPRALPGGTPRAGYRGGAGYAGSDRARAQAGAVAGAHGLSEVSAWTIAPLSLRCMLYRLPAGADREALLERLRADPRVQLAQPLNRFETLASAQSSPVPGYDDPYVGLQRGFERIHAAAAQKLARGGGVRVAVIDAAVDAAHPDLAGRVGAQRDFVGGRPAPAERHGTQVAGVIAAVANNGLGIVGVAPEVSLLAYRACWNSPGESGSHCNSYTLAEALAAAIAAGADVINLSLGGPADPLLERLASYAIARGAVLVAALPPGGVRAGFPSAVPGALVAADDGAARAGVLAAPGREVLTLVPGGGYDFASGDSLAAAHLSGAVALLRSMDSSLRGPRLAQLLQPAAGAGAVIDVCDAAQRLRAGAAACAAP